MLSHELRWKKISEVTFRRCINKFRFFNKCQIGWIRVGVLLFLNGGRVQGVHNESLIIF